MIVPVLVLDSHEQWLPSPIETLMQVEARLRPDDTLVISLDQLDLHRTQIDLPGDMKQPDVVPTVYHRCVRAGELWWHQFWSWWLYNPKKYAGFGEHEGDWELVQLGCIDEEGDLPVLMTCSQHSGGEKREYWRVELYQQSRPVVYVARDSHANYFTRHRDVTDEADGAGSILDQIEVAPFATWAQWPGKWGNSENSPGPLSTRRAWEAPHAYHSQARG